MGIFGFGEEVLDVVEVVVPSGVEVVDIVEVVVLGSSTWRTLVFRSTGSLRFMASGYSGTGLHGHARRWPAQTDTMNLSGRRSHVGEDLVIARFTVVGVHGAENLAHPQRS